MFDLRDAFAARGIWGQAGRCSEEEEEAEEGDGWVNEERGESVR